MDWIDAIRRFIIYEHQWTLIILIALGAIIGIEESIRMRAKRRRGRQEVD